MIHEALFSSAREDWETPQALYAALERCFGFRLDAAASAANAKAPAFFNSAQDALAQDWAAFGRVWLNPPYGRSIGRWMQKAAAEAARGCLVVALVPARTDTRWWRDSVAGKAQVHFLCGRLRYELEGKPQGAAPFQRAFRRSGNRFDARKARQLQHSLHRTGPTRSRAYDAMGAVLVYAPDLEALLSRAGSRAGADRSGAGAGGCALARGDRGPARGAVRG